MPAPDATMPADPRGKRGDVRQARADARSSARPGRLPLVGKITEQSHQGRRTSLFDVVKSTT